MESVEEANPAGLVFLYALCGIQSLTVVILINRHNCHQNGHIFKAIPHRKVGAILPEVI